MISELFQHRSLLRDLVGRDLAHRFAGSTAGIWWTFLQPITLVLLFYLVFAHLIATRLGAAAGTGDYAIYLCAGMLPWFAVQEAMMRASTLFRENAGVVRRIAFPPVLLVAQLVVSSLLVTAGVVALLLVVLALSGRLAMDGLIYLPPAFALLALLLCGIVLAVSVLGVFLRDMAAILPVVAGIWFWLSPVVYTPEILPAGVRWLLAVNPFLPVLDLFRRVVGVPVALHGGSLVSAMGSLLLVFIIGTVLFRGLGQDVADEI